VATSGPESRSWAGALILEGDILFGGPAHRNLLPRSLVLTLNRMAEKCKFISAVAAGATLTRDARQPHNPQYGNLRRTRKHFLSLVNFPEISCKFYWCRILEFCITRADWRSAS
jgi:hypothetical protein